MYADQPVTLAGEGAPGMSEFAIAEFAAACAMSTHQARALLGAAIECRHRLPHTWERVMAGEVAVWKARRVTERTHRLPAAAAAQVDTVLAPILATCSHAQIERAADAAAARVDDEHEEETRIERWEHQHLDIDLHTAALNGGLVPVHGLLDYLHALALEAAVAAGAAQLNQDHPELSWDIRRAQATGLLGQTQVTGTASPVTQIVVYTHHDPDQTHGIVDVEGHLGHTTLEQLETWCAQPGTRVTIRPVLDLAAEITVDRYQPTPAQHEQAILTCPTCVFPGCTITARRCDLDHITAYARGR